MRVEEVQAYLRTRAPSDDNLSCGVGRRRDAGYLQIQNKDEPKRCAVVASPGSRWFAVEITGGFSLDHFDEDLNDEDVKIILDDLVSVAIAYARLGGRSTRVGRLRMAAMVVSAPEGDRVLRRSLITDAKSLIPGRRRPPP
jgi:hypothetical protein